MLLNIYYNESKGHDLPLKSFPRIIERKIFMLTLLIVLVAFFIVGIEVQTVFIFIQILIYGFGLNRKTELCAHPQFRFELQKIIPNVYADELNITLQILLIFILKRV